MHLTERFTEKLIQNLIHTFDAETHADEIRTLLEKHGVSFKLKKKNDKASETQMRAVDMMMYSDCKVFWDLNLYEKLIELIIPDDDEDSNDLWRELFNSAKKFLDHFFSFEFPINETAIRKDFAEFYANVVELSLNSTTDYWHVIRDHFQALNPKDFPLGCIMNEGFEHVVKVSKDYIVESGSKLKDVYCAFYKFLRGFFMKNFTEDEFLAGIKGEVFASEEKQQETLQERKKAFAVQTNFLVNQIREKNC